MARYDRKDHLHQRAKKEGLRSRAAYKLDEVQKSAKLLARGQRVVDLGCWPGGWLERAGAIVGPSGRVVGVDRAELESPIPLAHVTALIGDLEDPAIVGSLRAALGGERADVLLSDAAPKLTGVREADRANEERLLEAIEGLIPALLRPGGSMLLKILEGPEAQTVDRRIRTLFAKAKTLKLASTRKGSTERYLIATGFRGQGGGSEEPTGGAGEPAGSASSA
jgi:23S rRNA (uridine2552-2'-O)-methyltransferase